jgi:hypothetical protein
MNKVEVEHWRVGVDSRLEELTVMGAKQSSELAHIKESVDEIKGLVKEQNGRVRVLEQQTSAIKAVGSAIAVIFSGFIGWLFNIRS